MQSVVKLRTKDTPWPKNDLSVSQGLMRKAEQEAAERITLNLYNRDVVYHKPRGLMLDKSDKIKIPIGKMLADDGFSISRSLMEQAEAKTYETYVARHQNGEVTNEHELGTAPGPISRWTAVHARNLPSYTAPVRYRAPHRPSVTARAPIPTPRNRPGLRDIAPFALGGLAAAEGIPRGLMALGYGPQDLGPFPANYPPVSAARDLAYHMNNPEAAARAAAGAASPAAGAPASLLSYVPGAIAGAAGASTGLELANLARNGENAIRGPVERLGQSAYNMLETPVRWLTGRSNQQKLNSRNRFKASEPDEEEEEEEPEQFLSAEEGNPEEEYLDIAREAQRKRTAHEKDWEEQLDEEEPYDWEPMSEFSEEEEEEEEPPRRVNPPREAKEKAKEKIKEIAEYEESDEDLPGPSNRPAKKKKATKKKTAGKKKEANLIKNPTASTIEYEELEPMKHSFKNTVLEPEFAPLEEVEPLPEEILYPSLEPAYLEPEPFVPHEDFSPERAD